MVLDILFASSGIEAEIVDGAEVVEVVEGLPIPLATVAALIALKVLARDDVARPQDRVDLRKLIEVATAQDLAEAQRLLSLVQTRGYARQQDLFADLQQVLDEYDAK